MFDCSTEIRQFHNDEVNLPEVLRTKLRDHRNANRDRLRSGLQGNADPEPTRFVTQGSYAMKTTIQEPDNDFDIDDGVVFYREDLKSKQGVDKSPLDARKMVCDALKDDKFKKQPNIKTNCVRVFYNEGHHVDIPVYRKEKLGETYDLASSEWKQSDPNGVNMWFEHCLQCRRTDKDNSHQMRRMIRLLKRFSKSRKSWSMPSGFVLTVLVDEKYCQVDEREDRAFYDLMVLVRDRLSADMVVRHPVIDENLTKTDHDPDMGTLHEKLEWAIGELQVLFDPQCTRPAALGKWGYVFNTDFFKNILVDQTVEKSSISIIGGIPKEPVDKRGGGRFGYR